jgi:hypothetical protein
MLQMYFFLRKINVIILNETNKNKLDTNENL